MSRGPWYVATLKNLHDDTTITYVHTYAFKAASVMNVMHREDSWIVTRLVGPFDELQDAEKQHTSSHLIYEWSSKSDKFVDTRVPNQSRVKMKDIH